MIKSVLIDHSISSSRTNVTVARENRRPRIYKKPSSSSLNRLRWLLENRVGWGQGWDRFMTLETSFLGVIYYRPGLLCRESGGARGKTE